MKKTIYIINTILFMGICLLITTTTPKLTSNEVESNITYVNSTVVMSATKTINDKTKPEEAVVTPVEEHQEEKEEKPVDETPKPIAEKTTPEPVKEEVKEEPKQEETPKKDDSYQETGSGTMSGYSAEKSNTYTKYHHNVKESITYNDSTFGPVRIIAAGYEFPAGTVIEIKTKGKLGTFKAIVLDRGGAVGIGKVHTFDLLYEKEDEAYANGVKKITYQVLRKGY